MTEIMTPSDTLITAGQIGKVGELLSAALRKSDLRSEPMQEVLMHQGAALTAGLLAVIRKQVEATSKITSAA